MVPNSTSTPPPNRRPPFVAIAIAAAVIVAVALLAVRFFSGDGDQAAPHAPSTQRHSSGRSADKSDAPAAPHASAVFPTGSFDEVPPRFVWTRDPAATSYRLEVRNESDAVVYSFETADSTIAFPAELVAQKGILSWRVVPKSAAGDLAPSAPLRFQVGP
jgi:hypothetical protein